MQTVNRTLKRYAPPRSLSSWVFKAAMALVLLLSLVLLLPGVGYSANPAPNQIYYVPMRDNDLLTMLEDIDQPAEDGAWPDPASPVRTIASITIGSTGTLVYYDQWEDGYEANASMGNPTSLYNSTTNPDGTQIWGDGILSNGCPPAIDNVANPCATAADDQFNAGDVITLDNKVHMPLTDGATPNGQYLDQFSTSAYNNSDGSTSWTTSWVESGDTGGATSGDIQVTGGKLRFMNAEGGDYISRVASVPATADRAILHFTINPLFSSQSDVMEVWATSGAGYTRVKTIDADNHPLEEPYAVNLTGFKGTSMGIRFRQASSLGSNQGWEIDDVEITWGEAHTRSASRVYYDGGDKIGATFPVALTRVGTPHVPGSVMAGATEMEEIDLWGTSFVAPVGEDTPDANTSAFEYVYLWIMAKEAGTTVQIDSDANGSVDDTQTLAEGANYYRRGIQEGATVTTNHPVQVHLVAADQGDTFEQRWYHLAPRDQWDSSYYASVGTAPASSGSGCTEVWAYNPNGSQITISVDRPGAATTTFNVAANDADEWPGSATNLAGRGLHLYTTGGQDFLPFQIIDCTKDTSGTEGRLFDWGYPLIPADQLTSQYLVGWAPGCTGDPISPGLCQDPDINGGAAASRSVIWVTPVQNTTVYVAFDGGDINCPGGAGADYSFSATALTSYGLVDDPGDVISGEDDYDMTGARIVTCNGVDLAVAYGQDPPRSGGNDAEALDLGTVVLPLAGDITLEKSVDKTLVPRGGSVTYTYLVRSTGQPLSDVSVTDNKCSPAVPTLSGGYNVGDTANLGFLDPGESWQYTCSTNIYHQTTNVAFASGTPDGGTTYIDSPPDEETVNVTDPAAIGDYVWFDEDGDGDQDAGEAGIPNVKVELLDNQNAVVATTWTDADGGYVFTGLAPGTYTVRIDTTTLPDPDGAGPAGLHPTYDEDSGTTNPDHQTSVTVAAGDEHMTADFGYNWATPGETNDPGNQNEPKGAIGDRVWIDADGQGDQDPGEPGLGGVGVVLNYDSDGDGVIDKVYGTTTTDDAGMYIFDELPPGIYTVVIVGGATLPSPGDAAVTSGQAPSGYGQTGDPDDTVDNKTTDPVVLGPGDVYLNADFGYQPSGNSGTIGDIVWLDADADGVGPNGNGASPGDDDSEYGIPNVTVALIKDSNGNGQWDAGEPIIATDVTDENGAYSFTGLPLDDGDGDADYLVWVNDTDNVLGEQAPTYDKDGTSPAAGQETGLGISATALADSAGNRQRLDQDFGYAPPGHDTGEGLIGDTIFLDRNGDNTPNAGEGLEGVRVWLYDSTGTTLLRTTHTDENGNYYFGDLEPSGTYQVWVDTTTLPNGGAGLTNTVDPDTASPGDSKSTVNLGADPDGIDLDQDFGYRDTSDPNTIEGTLWNDRDADGLLEGAEPGRFANVKVALYDSGGDIVGYTYTDNNGFFQFTGLPDGTYTVDVVDDGNVLNGFWHSLGTANTDNNSQVDPYTTSVGPGQRLVNWADFGYYVDPGALGNWVWNDVNGDGIQNDGAKGIPNVEVKLQITYPGGATVTVTTKTDASGYYSFPNLLLDEDYNGDTSTAPEPSYQISINIAQPALAAFTFPSPLSPPALGNQFNDSNNPAGTSAQPTQGMTDVSSAADGTAPASYDYGFGGAPTGVEGVIVGTFTAAWEGDEIVVRWATVSELDVKGFYVYRATSEEGTRTKLNDDLVPSAMPGSPTGADYKYDDETAQPGVKYYYWLEGIDLRDGATPYGPAVVVPYRGYLPLLFKNH